jgi:phosphoglycerate dehydrogenase-like enzyme
MEPLNTPLRIGLAGVALGQAPRLSRLLDFPHEFIAPAEHRQPVDAVISLRFGRAEAERYSTSFVHLPGAGADGIEFDVLAADCRVCNVFEHEEPVAEFVLVAMLDHAIGYGALSRAFSAERWSETYFSRRTHGEIRGKTLGLIGYGHIGKSVTRRAKAFGMRVCAVSNSGRAPEADWAGDPSRLIEMLQASDFVVVACPLTASTRGMIGATELRAMKSTAVLVNIGRAQIVDEEALYQALERGELAGATLDVWYDYPAAGDLAARPSRFRFDQLPNVRCTPHSSAWTEELFERRYAVIADNLVRLRTGMPLRNLIHDPGAVSKSAHRD